MNGIRIDSRLTQWIRLCRYCRTIGMNRPVGVRIIERFLQLINLWPLGTVVAFINASNPHVSIV